MTRSPLFYPLNRGMDAEAGGAADLQTDVMRFIAILSLCLVAIFALVQSIPLMPASVESPPQIEALTPEPPIPVTPQSIPEPLLIERPPQIVEEKPLVITRPAPKRMTRMPPAQEIIEEPTPAPPPAAIETAVAEMPAQTTEGFSLRFETDLALTRLVARNEVGLYAITPDKSVRMNVNRGALSFWAASVPNQFHEMDGTTVPADVQEALRRAGSVKISEVKWGVTLPSNMRQQLDRYLSEQQGGALVISGDGNLRLEP